MKKLIVSLFAIAMLGGMGVAHAEPNSVCPFGLVGCATVDSDPAAQYAFVFMTHPSTQPDPTQAGCHDRCWISVTPAGHVCWDDNGYPDDFNDANGPESDSPDCYN